MQEKLKPQMFSLLSPDTIDRIVYNSSSMLELHMYGLWQILTLHNMQFLNMVTYMDKELGYDLLGNKPVIN
jgi:hypothetical protein